MTVSVVIPTYNMSLYLAELWATIESSGLALLVDEIIFIDDGSSDNSSAVIESFQETNFGHKIVLIKNEKNEGRYLARLAGARRASGDHLLFLDTRISLPSNFGEAFVQASSHGCAMCMIDIETNKSLFNLYWQRTHEFIFKKHFKDARAGFFITSENFELYAKGTTGFLCSKTSFEKACTLFGSQVLQNDDAFLLKAIAQETPIWVHEDWKIIWEPRQNFNGFLDRLWERGPSFAEYHLFSHRGLYFKITAMGLLFVFMTVVALLFIPLIGKYFLFSALLIIGLSAIPIVKSIKEYVRLLPLHYAVCVVAGISVMRGIVLNLRKNARA